MSEGDIRHVIESNDEDALDGVSSYCIGCGSCAFVNPNFRIVKNDDGCYQATFSDSCHDFSETSQICPFASGDDENTVASDLFAHVNGIHYNKFLGYYFSTYVGYVVADGFRNRGSSGGMVSWLAAVMLEEGLVDKIIHVKDGPDPEHMYTYQISSNVDELETGAKSKYYPVEMSQVLRYVMNHDARYLFIGIPCFVKTIRLLCRHNDVLNQRIRYCVGLVCGHLKSDFFAKSEAWEAGVPLSDMERVDFRYKTPGTPASDYAVNIRQRRSSIPVLKRTAELSTTDWGLGYFKYNACDYCDDVLAETADVTFGDAWLPQYVNDSNGSNVVVVRNPDIEDLLRKRIGELHLINATVDEVYKSQAGGFRHRREGLQYRLWVHSQRGEWIPTKRVQPTLKDLSEKRKNIYAMRTVLKNESFVAFREAVDANDFHVFVRHMKPFIRHYQKIRIGWFGIVKHEIKQLFKRLIPKRFVTFLRNHKG